MEQWSMYCGYCLIVICSLVLLTDGRCTESWFYYHGTASCYFRSAPSDLASYNNSLQACVRAGGTLASVATVEESDFVYKTVIGTENHTNYWVGLWKSGSLAGTIQIRRERWEWLDGSRYNWINWYDGKDDEPSGEAGCARVRPDSYWGDTFCNSLYRYICKKPVAVLPVVATTTSTSSTTTKTTSTATPKTTTKKRTTINVELTSFKPPTSRGPSASDLPTTVRNPYIKWNDSRNTSFPGSGKNKTTTGVGISSQDGEQLKLYLFIAVPAGAAVIIVLTGVAICVARWRHQRKLTSMTEKQRSSRSFIARMKAAEASIGVPSTQPSPPSSLADMGEFVSAGNERDYANDREYPFHTDITMEDDNDLYC